MKGWTPNYLQTPPIGLYQGAHVVSQDQTQDPMLYSPADNTHWQ